MNTNTNTNTELRDWIGRAWACLWIPFQRNQIPEHDTIELFFFSSSRGYRKSYSDVKPCVLIEWMQNDISNTHKHKHKQRDNEWKKYRNRNRAREWIYLGNPMDLQLSQAYLCWPIWSLHVCNDFGGEVIPSHSERDISTEKLVGLPFNKLQTASMSCTHARALARTYTIRYTNFILFRNELNSRDFPKWKRLWATRFTFWPSHKINWIEWTDALILEWDRA